MAHLEAQSAAALSRLGALVFTTQSAVALGGGIALCIAAAAGWSGGSLTASTLPACAAVAVGAGAAVFLLSVLLRNSPDLLAPGVVAAGVLRSLVSLTLALPLYFVLHVDGRTFWSAFLAASVCSLIAESVWGITTNTRVHGGRAAGVAGASA